MSAPPTACEGAPRDLGMAQGRAHAGPIRDRIAREGLRVPIRWPWPRRFSGGATLGAGMGREIVRHYPHLAERLAGMATGAGLPVETLMELHVLSGYEPARWLPGLENPAGAAAANPVGAHTAGATAGGALAACVRKGHAQILRTLGRAHAPGSRWTTRRSKPEVGFASLEIVQPWGVAGVAGVNEAGLAVALAERCAEDERGSILPPAPLLVQECLQRFDEIEGAIEWCRKRPARSGSSLVLADGEGRIVLVRLRKEGVETQEAPEGVLALAADPERERALRAELEGGAELEPSLLARALGGEGDAPNDVDHVWIEPAARELQLRVQP